VCAPRVSAGKPTRTRWLGRLATARCSRRGPPKAPEPLLFTDSPGSGSGPSRPGPDHRPPPRPAATRTPAWSISPTRPRPAHRSGTLTHGMAAATPAALAEAPHAQQRLCGSAGRGVHLSQPCAPSGSYRSTRPASTRSRAPSASGVSDPAPGATGARDNPAVRRRLTHDRWWSVVLSSRRSWRETGSAWCRAGHR
jgi:hypothetical protein